MSDFDTKTSEKGEQGVIPIVQVNTLDSDHKNQGGAAVEETSFVPDVFASALVPSSLNPLPPQTSGTAVWSFLCNLSQPFDDGLWLFIYLCTWSFRRLIAFRLVTFRSEPESSLRPEAF